MNVASTVITLIINGLKSVRSIDIDNPTAIGSRFITITDSLGWAVYSDSLAYSDLSLVTNSYTILGFGFSIRHQASGVGTGQLEIDIDKSFINYVS